MTKGRLFKFMLNGLPINGNMDNFLFNIVKNRPRNQIYITGNKVALNSLDKEDYIFIQSENHITHFMKCKNGGPVLDKTTNEREISVKDIKKLRNPVKSIYKGQGYNKLNIDQIKSILISGH